ncbi:MAG: hypothetical protein IT319_20770, partial [Anaerolineae bacterium]|nr:hypothetical protein [Anaerolineae bacterium]
MTVETQEVAPAQARKRREWKEPLWLMPLVDMALAFLAFALAYVVRYNLQIIRPVDEAFRAPFEPYLPFVLIYLVWINLIYRGSGLYRVIRGRAWLDEVYTITNGVTNAIVVILAISFVFQPQVFSRLMMIYVGGITIVLLAGARVARRIIYASLRERGIGIQRVLVVG